MKRSLPFLFCVAATCVSCQTKHTDEYMARVGAVLNSRREASMTVWEDKKIRGLSPHAYAGLVTTMALPSDATVKLKQSKGPAGSVRIGIKVRYRNDDGFVGSVVAITDDGYFLTAAHCAENLTQMKVVVFTRAKIFAVAPARVIWKSAGPSEKGPDFALLHAPLIPFFPINMADPVQLRTGLPVLTSGSTGNKPGHSGGKILSLSKRETDSSGAHWRRVGHSAPTAVGDSGGPVIGSDGQLLAITTAGYWRFAFPFGLEQVWGHQSLAVAPDPDWIQSLIYQDRAGRKSKRPT